MSRTFYRIVHNATVGTQHPDDFTSDAGFGEPMPRDPGRAALHDGISVFHTEQQARNKARDYPFLGSFIAEVTIEDDAPVRVERTLRSSPGHHTLWSDPAELVRRVVAVVPV